MKKEKHMGKLEDNYDDRTKFLLERHSIAQNQFDKQINFLAGGGLVFSIGFVKDIIGVNKTAVCKELLFGVWICFAISLIVNLFSYLAASRATNFAINKEKCKMNLYDSITKILNIVSITTLLLGVVFLIWFSIINF